MASNEKKESGRDIYICRMFYDPNGEFSIGNARYKAEWINVPGRDKKFMDNLISRCCEEGSKYVDEEGGKWPNLVAEGKPDVGYWVGPEEKLKNKLPTKPNKLERTEEPSDLESYVIVAKPLVKDETSDGVIRLGSKVYAVTLEKRAKVIDHDLVQEMLEGCTRRGERYFDHKSRYPQEIRADCLVGVGGINYSIDNEIVD